MDIIRRHIRSPQDVRIGVLMHRFKLHSSEIEELRDPLHARVIRALHNVSKERHGRDTIESFHEQAQRYFRRVVEGSVSSADYNNMKKFLDHRLRGV